MYHITALYKFVQITPARLEVLKDEIASFCEQQGIHGLFLLSLEGCNGTVAGTKDTIAAFKRYLTELPEFGGIIFKDSTAPFMPFRRFKLDLREEIVTLKRSDIFPGSGKNHHLSPAEWHAALQSGEEIVLLDTRNTYETEIGMFRGAVDPHIENFSDFPAFVEKQHYPKEKKILMYCTGGIRCEKALIYMQEQGYENVFQLEGGILNYLQQYPDGEWDGECFVFDHRVAVDNHLQPSNQYKLCPHCGNPAKEVITCMVCKNSAIICHHCVKAKPDRVTCSKNCAYHAEKQALKQ